MLPVAMLGVGIVCSVKTLNRQRGFGWCCSLAGSGSGLVFKCPLYCGVIKGGETDVTCGCVGCGDLVFCWP